MTNLPVPVLEAPAQGGLGLRTVDRCERDHRAGGGSAPCHRGRPGWRGGLLVRRWPRGPPRPTPGTVDRCGSKRSRQGPGRRSGRPPHRPRSRRPRPPPRPCPPAVPRSSHPGGRRPAHRRAGAPPIGVRERGRRSLPASRGPSARVPASAVARTSGSASPSSNLAAGSSRMCPAAAASPRRRAASIEASSPGPVIGAARARWRHGRLRLDECATRWTERRGRTSGSSLRTARSRSTGKGPVPPARGVAGSPGAPATRWWQSSPSSSWQRSSPGSSSCRTTRSHPARRPR